MSIIPTTTHYFDHHKIIKAVEKCSLQATFGPEIASTKDLMPHHTINPAENPVPLDKIPQSSSAKPRTNAGPLPLDQTDEGCYMPRGLATNDGVAPVDLTDQRGNSPSGWSTNGWSMPDVSTYENGARTFTQSNFLGQVPLEMRSEKVS